MALTPRCLGLFLCAATLPQLAAAQVTDLQAGEAAYESGDFAASLQHWKKAAEAGDPMAAFDLGLQHDLGQGVPPSADTAFHWFLLAARKGLAEAQLNVGVMYDSGRGARTDRAKAALWYARAAIQGNARAAFNLGQLYQNGDGVAQNLAAAKAWYGLAAGKIDSAGNRARSLAAKPATDAAGELVPPAPTWPISGGDPINAAHATQLVWSAPPEPTPVVYFVELRSLEDGRFQEIASAYKSVNAFSAVLPGMGPFAWRVYAVSADRSNYAAGPWSVFSQTTDGSDTPAVPIER